MPFHSYIFTLAFLPITVTVFFLLNHSKRYTAADLFLIVASLCFYGYYNYSYVLFLLVSVGINYCIAKMMQTGKHNPKLYLLAGLVFNIGVLFLLKYYNFFAYSIHAATGMSLHKLNLILPIGISFYTFQQIAYLVDTYKNPNIGRYSVLEYTKYVTFFPYMIQGPIAYHHEIIPQFQEEKLRKLDYDNLAKGLWLFAIGMGKKVLLADLFGVLVDDSFANISGMGSFKAFIVMLSYTLQIYFDFSGYCDMATGVAKMFNVNLPLNFNSPYKALTISDFWKRWHITLTRFFTKYVYIPLGGNRKGEARTYLNILIVFLVSGLWHGANWTFIFWGMAHGTVYLLTRALEKHTNLLDTTKTPIKKGVLWSLNFLFVNLAWVMFRADSLEQGLLFYKELCSLNFIWIDQSFKELVMTDAIRTITKFLPFIGGKIVAYWLWLLLLGSLLLAILVPNETKKIENWKPSLAKMFFVVIILIYCILSFSEVTSFLYWEF